MRYQQYRFEKILPHQFHELEDLSPGGTQLAKMLPNIALGRTAVPENVARVVSFLAAEDSAYVIGQSIVVDGGVYFV